VNCGSLDHEGVPIQCPSHGKTEVNFTKRFQAIALFQLSFVSHDGLLMGNALGFTDFQWGTFHLDEKS
jgi:hypothetical protein